MIRGYGGKGLVAGLLTEATGTAGEGSNHAILIAIIAAVATVTATTLPLIIRRVWGEDDDTRLQREIERKDRRIATLERELDDRRRRE